MKKDLFMRVMMVVIVGLLFVNMVQSLMPVRPAIAQDEAGKIGRYQISSWAAQSGLAVHHNGYYIVDTMTGKIAGKHSEVHTSDK